MNKRGQFFLIAALIIVGIIVTLTTINISTKTSTTKTTALYDLSKEIDYESGSLIDYGVYNPGTDIKTSIDTLISNYSAVNPDTDLIFVYGDKESLTKYERIVTDSGDYVIAGAGIKHTTLTPEITDVTGEITGDNIGVELGNETLNFAIKPGQNFFIVLRKEAGEETIVAQK